MKDRLMQVGFRIKYNGVTYPAYTDFLVKNDDIKSILELGGWVVKEDNYIVVPDMEDKIPDVEDLTEVLDITKMNVNSLRMLAKEKGIEVEKNSKKADLIKLLS